MTSLALLTERSGRVKAARKLRRRAMRMSARRFLLEGPQALTEALGIPGCVLEVLATPAAQQRHPDIVAAATAAGVHWYPATETAVRSLADTVTPQGLMAVCGFVDQPLRRALEGAPRLVAVCLDVRDPGNAGTVLRCADAAGADAVILAGTSVDPYNAKTVRASVGSLFHLPVVFGTSAQDTVRELRAAGLMLVAADASGAELRSLGSTADHDELSAPTAWIFGNEAHGLTGSVLEVVDHTVAVPIYGDAESLNLASAAAVCMYASAFAQRSGTIVGPVGDGSTPPSRRPRVPTEGRRDTGDG